MDRYFPAFVTLHMHGDLEGAAAFAAWRQKETIITSSKEDVLARIQVSLASRAAEELFLNVNLNGVTGDFASATRIAAMYIGAYGMDGTLSSFLAFSDGLGGANPFNLPGLAERTEALLQSQFKAVRQLFQQHSEAVIAVAEALIEHEELVADDIKRLIDGADARQITKKVIAEFEPLLLNEGEQQNGHSLVNGRSNGHSNGSSALPRPNVVLNSEQTPFPTAQQSDLSVDDNPYQAY
jgi:cell division protease FtsH